MVSIATESRLVNPAALIVTGVARPIPVVAR
jgi:hypothetical protein